MEFPRFKGLITATPPPDSPLAYNEDTIVNLILQILTLHTRIRHIEPGELVYPTLANPTDGVARHQNLDLALCNDELHLSPRVTSLLGRIPYFYGGGSGPQIAFGSFLPDYLNPDVLRASRRINGLPPWFQTNEEELYEFLRPHDVVLTYAIDPDDMGETWVLDTEANSIRRRCYSNGCPSFDKFRQAFPDYQPELPDEPDHYRNAPALHAPTFLAGYVDDLRSLLFLPGWEMNWREVCFAYDYPESTEVRRRLIDEYGWPGEAFREEDWARDRERVWEEENQRSHDLYGDRQEGFELPAMRYIPPWV